MRANLAFQILAVSAMVLSAGCETLATAFAPDVETRATALRPGNYALDPDHAALIFKVDHLGFSTYVGRFERFDVSLEFEEDDPAESRVAAIIDMTSLDVANDDFAETLMGPGWFDAAAFPEAQFQSTGIVITGENAGTMTGDLTLHGVTAPVNLEIEFNGGGRDRLRGAYAIGLSARGEISRSAFGVDSFNGLVGDTVGIEIEAEFLRQ